MKLEMAQKNFLANPEKIRNFKKFEKEFEEFSRNLINQNTNNFLDKDKKT